jgi:hypothetical protein
MKMKQAEELTYFVARVLHFNILKCRFADGKLLDSLVYGHLSLVLYGKSAPIKRDI